jgi:hypothetical protein
VKSQDIVNAFAAHGLKVRVRDLGRKFRICPRDGQAFDLERVSAIANGLGLTGPSGLPITRFVFNGSRELSAYKPGAIVRVAS